MTPEEIGAKINELAIEQGRMSVRIDNMYEKINNQQKLLESVRDMAFALKSTSEEVCRLRTDVDEIKKAPSRTIETIKTAAITVVITGVLTFVITKLLGG